MEGGSDQAEPVRVVLRTEDLQRQRTAGNRQDAVAGGANPAVAIARSFTNTFSGIRPIDLPGFIVAELCGAVVGMLLMTWLLRPDPDTPLLDAEAKL